MSIATGISVLSEIQMLGPYILFNYSCSENFMQFRRRRGGIVYTSQKDSVLLVHYAEDSGRLESAEILTLLPMLATGGTH